MSRVISIEPSAHDPRVFLLKLDCGHQAEYRTRGKLPVRGKPRRRVHPCYICIDYRRERMEGR